jgi:polar amino acid transport system substrate-binding protein
MRRGLALLAIVTGLAAACSGSGSSSPTTTAPASPAAAAAGPTTTVPDCGDPRASTRPAGPLPAPGSTMPAGTLMATIKQRGRLIAGVSPDTLLFGSVNPLTAQFEGFDVDMVREVAKQLFGDIPNIDSKIEFRAVTNAERIPDVQQNAVDLVAHTMTINCARRQLVDFTSVYFDAGQKVLVRRDSAVQGIQDLGGKKVCAPLGTTSIVDETDCLVYFQTGQVDAISTDDTVLEGMAAQDPYAKVVGARFTDEPYGMAVNLDHPEFTQFVNAVLERVRLDGTWKAIYAKWLGRFGPVPDPPPSLYKN